MVDAANRVGYFFFEDLRCQLPGFVAYVDFRFIFRWRKRRSRLDIRNTKRTAHNGFVKVIRELFELESPDRGPLPFRRHIEKRLGKVSRRPHVFDRRYRTNPAIDPRRKAAQKS